jgi:bifunctional non-homologous end joining protein LigD
MNFNENMPSKIQPMLAKIGNLPKDYENWAYEFKWDGIRAIMYWNGKNIKIESRNLLDITFRYPELTDLGKSFGENVIVDGEIIAIDNAGKPNFSKLQQRMLISENKLTKSLLSIKIYYYLFDILFFNNKNIMNQQYETRRRTLEALKINHSFCRVPPNFKGKGNVIMSVARKHELEGVVCKKLNSVYLPGKRSDDWIKVKIIKSAEFIICGFKYGKTSKDRIGSLQLGAYNAGNKLIYVGAVGTGFDVVAHKLLLGKLEAEKTEVNPFEERFDKNVNFVKPRYVAQVEYRRWPEKKILQQASYKGLRLDKSPNEINLEEM